jgi:hypothetical protein
MRRSRRRFPPYGALFAGALALCHGLAVAGAQTADSRKPEPIDKRAFPPLAGRWAFVQVTTTASELPVVGTVYASTYAVVLHDLRLDGARLYDEGGRLCDLFIESNVGMVRTVLPEAFKRSLPPPVFDVVVQRRGAGWSLEQKKRFVVVGARLKDEKKGELPGDASDARLVDQDGDGKPGVTVRVEGLVDGEIYLAQRNWARLKGELKAPGLFAGRVWFGNEQTILGATSPLLKRAPKTRPVPERSWFRLVRLSNKATCADAMRLVGRAK